MIFWVGVKANQIVFIKVVPSHEMAQLSTHEKTEQRRYLAHAFKGFSQMWFIITFIKCEEACRFLCIILHFFETS